MNHFSSSETTNPSIHPLTIHSKGKLEHSKGTWTPAPWPRALRYSGWCIEKVSVCVCVCIALKYVVVNRMVHMFFSFFGVMMFCVKLHFPLLTGGGYQFRIFSINHFFDNRWLVDFKSGVKKILYTDYISCRFSF